MLQKKLNKACVASAGHTRFMDHPIRQPVVVSAKRFAGILGRSQMAHKQEKFAAEKEDNRYMQYLKDGNDCLCSYFENLGHRTLEEERQEKLDQEMREDEIRKMQVKKEDEQLRKERIMRANLILKNLKSSQTALHRAQVESEVIYQRKYNEALNREIAEDALRQQRFDEQQCPLMMIPFGGVTEAEEKTEVKKKAEELRKHIVEDIETRRLHNMEAKEQEICDVIVERAQYKCLQDVEERKAKEKAARAREFHQEAYRVALNEKAERAKYEHIRDEIEDRKVCVELVTRRILDTHSGKATKEMRAQIIRDREDKAIKICHLQQAKKRQEEKLQLEIVHRHEVDEEKDELRRQCHIEELGKERKAYQLEERRQQEEKRQREAEIRRFKIAERFKNQKANTCFYAIEKQRKEREKANLRDFLYGQRDEFLQRSQDEQMRRLACQDDSYLRQDVTFFDNAAKMMTDARKEGRSVFPIAKAVKNYRRQNQIEKVPQGRMVHRNRLRDYCWPGYISKADLACKQYEHRENCRQKEEKDRQDIFANCIRITKMASEETSYKTCEKKSPIKCYVHRDLPAIKESDFHEDDCVPDACPSGFQALKL